jgi:hypothetical protein
MQPQARAIEMPIVSSEITATNVQKDGRIWVRELHTDQVAVQYVRNYLANATDDLNAALAAYAIILSSNINLAEIASNVASVTLNGSLATISLVYSTAADNRAAGRAAYLNSTRTEAIMIGDFLNTLTDAQLANIFNITTGQAATLRTNKLAPAASLATSIRSAMGQ